MVERSRNRQKFKKENIEVEPSFSKKHAATTSELKLSKKKSFSFEKKGKRREREREREKRERERAREQQRVAKGERGERTGGSSGWLIFVVALPDAIRYIRDCADLQGDSLVGLSAVKRRRRASRRRPPIGGSRPQGAALITRPCNTPWVSLLHSPRKHSTVHRWLRSIYTPPGLRLPPRATDLYPVYESVLYELSLGHTTTAARVPSSLVDGEATARALRPTNRM